jgi:sugar phosphate isomerase/epimerase
MDVKLGVCNFCVPGTGVFAPRFVAEAGLDGMSIEFGTYDKGFPLASRKLQEAYLDAQQKHGIEYPNIGLSGFDFIPFHARENNPLHGTIKKVLKNAVEAAAFMKIPLVFVPTFQESDIKSDEDFECAVIMFQYLCDLAGEKGVSVASENPMDSAAQIELVNAVGRKNFGLFYDSDNYFYGKGYDQVEILEDLYDHLVPQLHVKDGKKGVLAGSLLGEGEANFYGVMDVLKKRNYQGWLILENLYEQMPLRARNEDVFKTFLEDVRILRKAIS